MSASLGVSYDKSCISEILLYHSTENEHLQDWPDLPQKLAADGALTLECVEDAAEW